MSSTKQSIEKGIEDRLDALLLFMADFGTRAYRDAKGGENHMRALRSVEEAAGLLGISKWTVRSYIREGKLRPVRLGRRVLLSEDELERFVNESQQSKAGDVRGAPAL